MRAAGDGAASGRLGILVDEEFGSAILRDAHRRGVVTAMSTERSGSDEYDFEYGTDTEAHLDAFDPTFAKALVRFNPDGDAALNARQCARLRTLSQTCRRNDRALMFELLVPATREQLAAAGGDKSAFDATARPALMERAIRQLQDTGVEPDVWKIEGLATRADCERIVATARRDGRASVTCIVLGRGADADAVTHWLETAAEVPGFVGFAVGRTTFWDALVDYRAQKATRDEATTRIAARFERWITTFERGRSQRRQRAPATGSPA